MGDTTLYVGDTKMYVGDTTLYMGDTALYMEDTTLYMGDTTSKPRHSPRCVCVPDSASSPHVGYCAASTQVPFTAIMFYVSSSNAHLLVTSLAVTEIG